jgi:hypothetical protein
MWALDTRGPRPFSRVLFRFARRKLYVTYWRIRLRDHTTHAKSK